MFRYLRRAENLGASFADIRFERVKTSSITITEDRKYVSRYGIDEGYSIRVITNRNLGFKVTNKIDEGEIEDVVNNTYGDERVNIVYLPSKHDSVKIGKDISKSIEEESSDLDKIATQIKSLHPSIRSFTLKYSEEKFHKEYYSTEDREITIDGNLSSLSIFIIAREGDITAEVSEIITTHFGYVLETFDINQILEKLRHRLENQLKGVVPKGGEYPVVLAPEVVGVFTHEAVGHLAEADTAVNGLLYQLRGKKIGEDFLNISDLPIGNYPQSTLIYYDDEGVEGREVKILEKGVVKEFMTDRYYSAYLGQPPTGNSRAQNYRNVPLIRMRNTYMLPGNSSLDEIFEGIKEGYYLVSPVGGETSADGTFQFAIQEGYRIENGQIKEPLRNVGISGYTIEALGMVELVSKDFGMSNGYCGKGGQEVHVSDGGPYVRVKRLKVGGYV
ncbi:zinc metalloprotease TldD [Sulfolobus tengchongensis]|uniref:Zinc metalloprotease TldD n=1 Tax=Sulfolobus tengchongensis TaxID=207809 RepID=A0AAX4L0M6_9CREN